MAAGTQHDHRLQWLFNALPAQVQSNYERLIHPKAKWVRRPLGILLIVGGVFSFLPVSGLWILPIGALLLGEDIPPSRRATLSTLGRTQHWWDKCRSSRAK